jgi:hypothetical protein
MRVTFSTSLSALSSVMLPMVASANQTALDAFEQDLQRFIELLAAGVT